MIHRPHQGFCMRCKNLKSNCDKLEFDKMEPQKFQGAYAGIITLVICSEYKERIR